MGGALRRGNYPRFKPLRHASIYRLLLTYSFARSTRSSVGCRWFYYILCVASIQSENPRFFASLFA